MLPNFGSKCSDALVGAHDKEKVIATFHHRYQHPLYQVVVRIDQYIVRFEPIELENELNDLEFSSPEQGVTKIESERGDFWWDDFVRSER